MSEPNVGVAAVRQPWTLRGFLARRTAQTSADEAAALRVTLGALVGSRLLVWLGALGALSIFGRNAGEFNSNDALHLTEPFRTGWANFLFAPTARWDSVWYLAVAHFGYFSRPSSGFFPLYPLLIHLGASVFGSEVVVGTLISLASMTIALYILYLLTRLDMGEHAARTTVLLLALFPTAFFLSAVYTEALFLMLSVGAIYAARQDRWALAAVLAGLASASRVNGILLVVPLLLMYLYGPRGANPTVKPAEWWRPRYRLSRSSLWLLLVPVGLAAYLVYLWITHDAPLAPFQVQQKLWEHTFVGPFGSIVTLALRLPNDVHRLLTGHVIPVGPGDPIGWNVHDLIDVPFLAFALAGLVFSWRRVPRTLFVYGLVYLAYALCDPTRMEALEAFPRFLLLAFPVFMGWGGWLAERRLARSVTLTGSAALLIVFSGLWGVWAWVA